ncbi:MAG: hypothetical protein IJM73_02045 [Spirochaetales bacterium]|nr:hypothetical protein [Spirochaetales bacterium]
MYCIQTFGLGHNHGCTALFVEEFYNRNIPNINYFNALDGDRAVAEMNRIAASRGDTESIGRYDKMIEVLMPETVRRRPIKEHDKGDEFINKLNAISEAAPDALTAGLLIMAAASK